MKKQFIIYENCLLLIEPTGKQILIFIVAYSDINITNRLKVHEPLS